MTEVSPTFGELLRRLRVAAGLTQQELAARAQISTRAISDLERGLHQVPHRDTVARIAAALPLPEAERAALGGYLDVRAKDTQEPLPRQLPRALAPLNRFIGREHELAEVHALLDETRLLTLTGPGGIGKTRLAAEVVRAHALPTVFVDVAVVDSAQRLEEAVASGLGVVANPERDLTASIAVAAGAQAQLLLLDNCEHVLEPAAALVDGLLRACPQLTILVTSREPLHVPGELSWLVPPLELPEAPALSSPETVGRSAAVRLFVERARSRSMGFTLNMPNAALVADVCRRLDGIPLALELAAARVHTLGIEELAARLDKSLRVLVDHSSLAAPRQRTLRASLDWSHALLSEPERTLFARLAVFSGGWSIAAAEAVCSGGGLAQEDVLDLMTRLVDQSLVTVAPTQMTGVRYRFLETVREYAAERLVERGELQDLRCCHAAYYRGLAVQAERELWTADQATWMQRMRDEVGNVRAALEWGMSDVGDVELALRLAGALGWFWSRSGLVGDARGMLARLLARGGRRTVARAWALNGAASLAYFSHDPAVGVPAVEEALAIATELGDAEIATYAHVGKAVLALLRGETAAAETTLQQGLPLARTCADTPPLYNLLWALAETARQTGDDIRAERLLREALALVQAHGDTSGTGYVLFSLGHLLLERGEIAGAATLFLDSLAVRAPAGDALSVTHCLDALASVALMAGAQARAARLFAAAVNLRQTIGGGPPPLWVAAHEQGIAAVRSALGEAPFAAAWAAGSLLTLDEALTEAAQVGGIA